MWDSKNWWMFKFKSSKPPFRRKILDVQIERAYDAGYAACVTLGRSLGFWTQPMQVDAAIGPGLNQLYQAAHLMWLIWSQMCRLDKTWLGWSTLPLEKCPFIADLTGWLTRKCKNYNRVLTQNQYKRCSAEWHKIIRNIWVVIHRDFTIRFRSWLDFDSIPNRFACRYIKYTTRQFFFRKKI